MFAAQANAIPRRQGGTVAPVPWEAMEGEADAAARLREALYVGVGLGVLGFQRAQVQRRALERQFQQLRVAAGQLEARLDPVMAEIEDQLPEPARGLARQVRSVVRDRLQTSPPRPPGRHVP